MYMDSIISTNIWDAFEDIAGYRIEFFSPRFFMGS